MPKISVLLPTHNRADVIRYAIESVLYQTEQDFELLIVGDGCTDNTAEVIKPYLKDKRIKWFDLPKGFAFGYANRNIALKQAKGKYIGFMAHDDILLTDHFELLLAHIENSPATDIVYSRPFWVTRDGYIMLSSFNLHDEKMFNHFMKVGNALPAACFLHRRSCFDKVGYWDEASPGAGDWDMWKRIIRIRPNNWAFENQPTNLHFLANWRKPGVNWPHEHLMQIARKNRFFPNELHIKPTKGKTEQETFWNQISKNPRAWNKKIRELSFTLLDAVNNFITLEFGKVVEEGKQSQKIIQSLNNELYMTVANYNKMVEMYENSSVIKLRNKMYKIIRLGK